MAYPHSKHYLQMITICKLKIVFYQGVLLGKQTAFKGRPHDQQQMANTKQTKQHLWRLCTSKCWFRAFFFFKKTLQVFWVYIMYPSFVSLRDSYMCEYVYLASLYVYLICVSYAFFLWIFFFCYFCHIPVCLLLFYLILCYCILFLRCLLVF